MSEFKGKIIQLKKGMTFYNAPETAGDKIEILDENQVESYDGAFIDFWEEKTKTKRKDIDFLCANKDCPYEDNILEYDLEGGHIVGKLKEKMKDGDRFCIVPLCPKCNSSHNKEKMTLRYDVQSPVVIWRE